jgi:TP901 family phage tail tape measure protein
MAKKYDIGPKIGIEGEKEFRDAIKQINDNLKVLKSEMVAVTSVYGKNNQSVEALTGRNKMLNTQIDEQRKKVEQLNKGLEECKKKYGDNSTVTQAWQKDVNYATAELNDMERELKENEAAIKGYGKAQLDAAKQTKEFQRAQQALKDTLGTVVKAAKIAGAAILAVLGASAKAAIDYETAFTGVRKTVNATEEELAALSDGIRQMAKEIPASTTEIAAVAEAAGQLGIEPENILLFSRTMIDLGETTNMSADQAAVSLARLANITQMPEENFDRLGATVVALGNNLATTEGEIVEMGLRLAGAGSQVGMTEDQILSLAGALSSVGIEAQMGGSAFSRVMVQMQLAVKKGGDELNNFAAVAGVDAATFASAWEDDALGAILMFIEGLSTAEERGMSAIEILDEMGITEIRLRDALLRAAGASDVFSEAVEIGSQAWEENSALTEEAELRYGTAAAQIQITKNIIHDAAIEIGNKLAPKIAEMNKRIQGFNLQPIINAFGWLIDNGVTIASIAAAIAAGMAAWKVTSTIDTLVKGFKVWRAATQGVSLAQAALNLVMSANPIGLIVTAVAALVAGLVVLWNTNEKFREFVTGAWQSIKEVGISVFGGIGTFITKTLPEAFWNLLGFIGGIKDTLISLIVGPILTALDWLNALIPRFNQWVADTVQTIKDKFSDMKEIGKDIVRGLWEGIKAMGSWITGKVKSFFSGITKTVKGVLGISSPSKVFKGIGTYTVEGMVEGIESASDRLYQAAQSMGNVALAGVSTVNHQYSGIIRVEGNNDRGQTVKAVDMIVSEMRRGIRMA